MKKLLLLLFLCVTANAEIMIVDDRHVSMPAEVKCHGSLKTYELSEDPLLVPQSIGMFYVILPTKDNVNVGIYRFKSSEFLLDVEYFVHAPEIIDDNSSCRLICYIDSISDEIEGERIV